MSAAPEIVTMLLSNEDCMVLNTQGFPLSYNDSEVEVMGAAMKYLRARNTRGDSDRHVTRLLLSVTDKSALSTSNPIPIGDSVIVTSLFMA